MFLKLRLVAEKAIAGEFQRFEGIFQMFSST